MNLVFSRLKNPENGRANVTDDYSGSHDVLTGNKSVVTSIREIAHTSHSVAFSDETSLSVNKNKMAANLLGRHFSFLFATPRRRRGGMCERLS